MRWSRWWSPSAKRQLDFLLLKSFPSVIGTPQVPFEHGIDHANTRKGVELVFTSYVALWTIYQVGEIPISHEKVEKPRIPRTSELKTTAHPGISSKFRFLQLRNAHCLYLCAFVLSRNKRNSIGDTPRNTRLHPYSNLLIMFSYLLPLK